MPVKPQPFMLSCPACRWCRVYAPASDVVTAEMMRTCCPRCHGLLRRRALPEMAGAVVAFVNALASKMG